MCVFFDENYCIIGSRRSGRTVPGVPLVRLEISANKRTRRQQITDTGNTGQRTDERVSGDVGGGVGIGGKRHMTEHYRNRPTIVDVSSPRANLSEIYILCLSYDVT